MNESLTVSAKLINPSALESALISPTISTDSKRFLGLSSTLVLELLSKEETSKISSIFLSTSTTTQQSQSIWAIHSPSISIPTIEPTVVYFAISDFNHFAHTLSDSFTLDHQSFANYSTPIYSGHHPRAHLTFSGCISDYHNCIGDGINSDSPPKWVLIATVRQQSTWQFPHKASSSSASHKRDRKGLTLTQKIVFDPSDESHSLGILDFSSVFPLLLIQFESNQNQNQNQKQKQEERVIPISLPTSKCFTVKNAENPVSSLHYVISCSSSVLAEKNQIPGLDEFIRSIFSHEEGEIVPEKQIYDGNDAFWGFPNGEIISNENGEFLVHVIKMDEQFTQLMLDPRMRLSYESRFVSLQSYAASKGVFIPNSRLHGQSTVLMDTRQQKLTEESHTTTTKQVSELEQQQIADCLINLFEQLEQKDWKY